jgi:hypothetical protein
MIHEPTFDVVLTIVVGGSIVIALAVDVAAIASWLRNRWGAR